MGGSYIGRPAPELTVVESQEGSDLKLRCADTTYLAAIAEDGEIYLNGYNMHPLEKGDFTVNLDNSTLTIAKNKLEVGENTICISVGGYQDKEMKVDYGKTVEETVLEVEAGNVGEEVTVTVAGENATGDIWEYLEEVKLTYPGGTEKNVLPDGDESVYKEIGYEISGKHLILGKDLFTQPGEYQVTITAEYYDTTTVKFTVVDGTSTETKPVPQYDKVECELDTSWRTKYTFVFTSSHNDDIEAWIDAVNKVAVNGTEYSYGAGDPYFTTGTTDHQIILHGDTPFTEGDNTVVISAEDYEDLTLTVGKDGTIGGDAGENPEEPGEDQAAPKAESLDFVDQSFWDDYYRLKFDLTEDDASAYLQAITSIEIDGEACEKVQSFRQDTNSYKFSKDESYGGAEQFIDFTADCFAVTDKSYTVEIIADGYETLTLSIKNNNLVDGDEPTEPEENKEAPSVKSLVFKKQMLSSYYRLSFDLSETDASAYLNVITSIEIDGNSCKMVSGFWGEKNAYKFSNDEAYGGRENQFIDFTEDCFSGDGEHTLTISADGYKTLTYTYPAQ